MNSTGKFEDRVGRFRQDMDIEQPDEERLWEGIRQGLHTRRRSFRRILLPASVAATILLLLSLGYAWLAVPRSLPVQDPLQHLRLRKTEARYEKRVRYLKEELQEQEIAPEITEYYKKDLDMLDTLYHYCLNDLLENGYNERTVMLMLDTYEKRLMIYERISLENQRNKNYTDDAIKTLL